MRYEYPKSAATVKRRRPKTAVKQRGIVDEYHIEIDGKVLLLRRTFAGRVLNSARRFAQTFPVALLAIGVLFAIEWVGRNAEESHLVFYVGSALAVAALFATAFSMTRFFRDDLWALDLGERILAFETSMPWGQAKSAHIRLSEVQGFFMEHEGRKAHLKVRLDGNEETLASGGPSQVTALADEVRAFLKRHRSNLRVE